MVWRLRSGARRLRRPWRHLWLVLAVLAVGHCRGMDPNRGADSDTLADTGADKPWYDSVGNGAPCDPPADKCAAFKDDKDFVDQCVTKGFQARTCGCSMRCSGKFAYADTAAAAAAAAAPAKSCDGDGLAYVNAVAQNRKPGTSLDRCIDSHVCNGNIGSCAGDDLQTTIKLRGLAAAGCETEVLNGLCRDGSLATLACPEAQIESLSRIWETFAGKDSAAKRCMRGVICSQDRSACNAATAAQAQATKAAVGADGCDYWLGLFCNLGATSW